MNGQQQALELTKVPWWPGDHRILEVGRVLGIISSFQVLLTAEPFLQAKPCTEGREMKVISEDLLSVKQGRGSRNPQPPSALPLLYILGD